MAMIAPAKLVCGTLVWAGIVGRWSITVVVGYLIVRGWWTDAAPLVVEDVVDCIVMAGPMCV